MATPRRAHGAAALSLAASLFALLLAGCGAPPSPITGPVAGESATATITIDGGSLVVADLAGTTLRLTIPPEAVVQPLNVTLTPVDSGDARARFDLEPNGPRLQLRYELRLAVPPDGPLAGGRLYLEAGSRRVPLLGVVDTATRRVTASTHLPGLPDDEAAPLVIPGPPPVAAAPPPSRRSRSAPGSAPGPCPGPVAPA